MGIHLLRVKFSTSLSTLSPQFSQYSFIDFASYTLFSESHIEEKSELEKSIEANMQEADR